VDLYTGAWKGERKLEHFAIKLMGIIPIVIALRAPRKMWVVLKNPVAEFAKYGTQLAQINQAIYIGLRIVLIIAVITFALEVGNWFLQSYRRSLKSAA
jgi:hypothetical protein